MVDPPSPLPFGFLRNYTPSRIARVSSPLSFPAGLFVSNPSSNVVFAVSSPSRVLRGEAYHGARHEGDGPEKGRKDLPSFFNYFFKKFLFPEERKGSLDRAVV